MVECQRVRKDNSNQVMRDHHYELLILALINANVLKMIAQMHS